MSNIDRLIKKAREEWGENWNPGMMEEQGGTITVWVGRTDIYKAFFDAETLQCVGTKC